MRRRAHAASPISAAAVFVDLDRRATDRRFAREVGGRAAVDGGGDEVVAVAVGDERHEELPGQRPNASRTTAPSIPRRARPGVHPSLRPPGMPATSWLRTVPSWGERRADQSRRAVRRPVRRTRRQPDHRRPRARRSRSRQVPDHPDRHLDRWRVVARDRGRRSAGAGPRRRSRPNSIPHGERLSPSADARRGGRRARSARWSSRSSTGPMGEDGTVQGLLELANVAYVGSGVLGSARRDGQGDGEAGARPPPGSPRRGIRSFAEHQITPGLPADLADELGLPCFVKPANMGSSVGCQQGHDRRSSCARRSSTH